MSSFYAQYVKERSNRSIIETDKGFVTYCYTAPDTVYIEDIFVVPEFRKGHIAANMADLVVKEAKDKGCKTLLGSVVPSSNNSTISLKVLLAYGMKLVSSSNDFIVFSKEI